MTTKKNPYTLVFGKEPSQLISRISQERDVIENFTSDDPSWQLYMITGVRGMGKTVFMTDIASKLKKEKDWIVVELNPEKDLLESLASKLSSNNALAQIFKTAKINLSFFGFGMEISGVAPITNIESALSKMIESLKKHGKKLLITIDEVTNTKDMRVFCSTYQILVRDNLPVFLLMTGLYDNIYELQNVKTLTFLYRAPKIILGPLNIGTIAANYRQNFDIDNPTPLKMAQTTRGYSFAFQVLGYLTWKYDGNFKNALPEYKQYLEEYVYEKIWSEMSPKDKYVAYGIVQADSSKISDIRKLLNMTTNEFNPYRQRLIQKGVVDGSEHGRLTFTLPLFEEFISENYIPEM